MTKDEARTLYETGWWEGLPADTITAFQLFEDRLCMDFRDFHAAVEQSLERPVYTHEFAYDALRDEFLGKRPKATLQEIIDLIPADKRIVIAGEE